MKKPVPKITIILLNWNGWRDTVACLDSLAELDYPNFDIVCIDNDSQDDSAQEIQKWIRGQKTFASVEYAAGENILLPNPAEQRIDSQSSKRKIVFVRAKANLGFSGGNNIGLKYAMSRGYDYVWLLNTDTIAAKDALSRLVQVAEENDRVGIVGSKLIRFGTIDEVQNMGNSSFMTRGKKIVSFWRSKKPRCPEWVWAASLLMRMSCLKDVGLLVEDYFFTAEDVDWCFRARRKGCLIAVSEGSKVWHKEKKLDVQARRFLGRSLKLNTFEYFINRGYYEIRNQMAFALRHRLSYLPFLLFVNTALFLKIILFYDHKPARVGVLLRGLKDGLLLRMGKKKDKAKRFRDGSLYGKEKTGSPNVAIVHPLMVEGGGSEARALWLAEALRSFCRVSLITGSRIDLENMNKAYGTTLDSNSVTIIAIQVPKLLWKRFAALRSFRLCRYCQRHSSEYDVMISSYNILDFKRRGIQFIADFSFDDELREQLDSQGYLSRKLIYRHSLLRNIYLRFGAALSGQGGNGWRENMTIANSEWSRQILRDAHGIESTVIYPPVWGEYPNIPWEQRENGFIFMGRISPEKRIERIIAILCQVRDQGFDIHLHICGRLSDVRYGNQIHSLARDAGSWVEIGDIVRGDEKRELLVRHRYGISGRTNEPFGIVIAEMIKGGCIAWVPDGGGQTEIVAHPQLIFKTDEEAVRLILDALRDQRLQMRLRDHLSLRSSVFTEKRFCADASRAVMSFLGK